MGGAELPKYMYCPDAQGHLRRDGTIHPPEHNHRSGSVGFDLKYSVPVPE